MNARSHQLRLGLKKPRTHGGARRGAGRKPRGARAGVSHHGRPTVTRHSPVHVTLRVLGHVWNLRSRRALHVIEAALAGVRAREDFRAVHFSVQGNHVHLVVEANGNAALATGMQALSVRLARGLNRMMGARGKVLADRYHAHVLRTPAEVRRALAYVLLNFRSHMARLGKHLLHAAVDPFSSGGGFDGWKEASATGSASAPTVTSRPRTWLLAVGWRRRGLLSVTETPASSA